MPLRSCAHCWLTAGLLTACSITNLHAAEPISETPLADQLNKMSAGSAKRFPAAMRSKFAQGIEDVRATGILDKALKIGDQTPDAVLLGGDGEVQLSSLWADQPLVITFYRGGWCPYCNASLRAMEAAMADLGSAGARVVAVTPELPEMASKTVAKNGLSLMVLTDKGNRLAGEMGIAFRLPQVILPIYRDRVGLAKFNGDEEYTLPLAATYVIDTEGVIRWAFVDADYKKRAEPADVVAAVQSLGGAVDGGYAPPEPTIPHQQLAREAGVWDAEMSMWMAPGAPAMTMEAMETNTMLGAFWVVSQFECDNPEMPFSGRMQLGYDPQKEKFIGTWVDTMSPYASHLEGDYDVATHSLTMVSHGVDARTGEPSTSTMVTQYEGQDTKTFTMYEGVGTDGWKMMEIRYKRRK